MRNRWVTVGEAAKLLGVTRQRVHQLIREGLLPAVRAADLPETEHKPKRKGVWLVSPWQYAAKSRRARRRYP
jgi:hypothetical protein